MSATASRPELSLVRRPDYWLGEFAAMASPCQVLSKADCATARKQLEAAAAEVWRIEAKYSRYRAGNIVDRTRPTLALAPRMQIDLGGVGKEYAVDRAASLAGALCPSPCLVNLGGDIAAVGETSGHAPWRVGIESIAAGVAEPFKRIGLAHGGLATSGDARRFLLKDGVRYSHVLDPRTGWPVAGAPRSVTVAADTCTEAGMLSTLAVLMGPDAESFLERQGVRYWSMR